ncbi:hypothetical protein OC846_003738 [Tilletia horrida]|uniref:Uncharacterized protein n=1 Tax=Tilletia horrida TaxID=155126 RepID=A0AAN6JXP0_9BASI|nr:hypothetical protein OC845_003584 [Tilletia horrida]KAK0550258.1 hypothetical protein OC846_003738 [Tilletia horrida]KAK0565404.1 hypothetical protein OC861_003774 [Tilletia horrida]
MDQTHPPQPGIPPVGAGPSSISSSASAALFIPRSRRNNPAGFDARPNPATLAHASERQLQEWYFRLSQAVQLTQSAAHVPNTARLQLESDAQLIQREIDSRRARSMKGQGPAGTSPSFREVGGWVFVQHGKTQVDQLGGAMTQLQLSEAGPSGSSSATVSAPLHSDPSSSTSGSSSTASGRGMTFKQQLAQGIVTAVSPHLHNDGFQASGMYNRRTSGQGPMTILEPCSSALAEAEALQSADRLRAEEANVRREVRQLAAQHDRAARNQQQESRAAARTRASNKSAADPDSRSHEKNAWSFYTPEFGDDGDDTSSDRDEDEDQDTMMETSQMGLSQSMTKTEPLSQSSSTLMSQHHMQDSNASISDYPLHRSTHRLLDGGSGADDEDLPDISAEEQHALEAAQEAEAIADAQNPSQWAWDAVMAREERRGTVP